MSLDYRQLAWLLACAVVFLLAIWLAQRGLGAVAGRSVLIISYAGLLLTALALIGPTKRILFHLSPTSVPDQRLSEGPSVGGVLIRSLWVVGFLVMTPIIGIIPSIIVFCAPAMWYFGEMRLHYAIGITLFLCGFLVLLNRFLNLSMPNGVIF